MKTPSLPKLPPDLLNSLGLKSFVAFDVETTGLDPQREKMIEVGAVRFENGVETNQYSSLIACPYQLPPNIVKLTGIDDEMLKNQPDETVVLPELMEFVGDEIIVGQNVSFDLSFLNAALKRAGIKPDKTALRAVDTALIARVLLPTLQSRGLSSLGRYFNLDVKEAHRAVPDARRAGQVLLQLLSYFNRVDIKTVDLLRRISDGLYHPSAWIFGAWAEYLIKTSSVEGSFKGHTLPNLYDNIIGKLPSAATLEAAEAQSGEDLAYQEVDEGEISGYFSSDSALNKVFSNFEFRPQQEEMSRAVAEIFNQEGLLAVEAGTGVGKSIAYLIPAIYWAQANRDLGERVIISTNTKNLQEQLFFKDIPSLVEALPKKFSAVLLKGRNNYLCRRRWINLTTSHLLKISNREKLALLSLVLWVEQTLTGDVAEVSAFGGESSSTLWARIASDAGSCRGRRCRERNRCYHARTRAASARAHLVVVNHALLMADLAADHVPIGAYSTLVIDEAHHLERAASQHLGSELNLWMFNSWTARMYDAEGVPTGLLAQILLGVGAAKSDHPLLISLMEVAERTARIVTQLHQLSEEFFSQLTSALRTKVPADQTGYSQKLRLRQPDQFMEELPQSDPSLGKILAETEEGFGKIIDTLGDIPVNVLPQSEDWLDDLRGGRDELQQYHSTLKFFQTPADENWVYWAELPQRQEYNASLYAAPLRPGDILRELLFDPLRATVVTSATLTVADRFHYFLRKIGLADSDNITTLKLGSPFEFESQMLIGLTSFLASPKNPQFEVEVVRLLQELLKNLSCGTLGLFTSHKMMRNVGQVLDETKSTERLLVQGVNGSRDHLLRKFRENPGSVLLGTDSFWEGIDVVGEALELLIVVRIPFEVPTEPLVEARIEKLKSEGKDAFMYYTVPEAIIRLRQGVGRLIRSKTDRGAALILDSRLASTRYGEAFLRSLPVEARLFKSKAETIQAIESFLSKERS